MKKTLESKKNKLFRINPEDVKIEPVRLENMKKLKLSQKDKLLLLIDYENVKLDIVINERRHSDTTAIVFMGIMISAILLANELVPNFINPISTIISTAILIYVLIYLIGRLDLNHRISRLSKNLDKLYQDSIS